MSFHLQYLYQIWYNFFIFPSTYQLSDCYSYNQQCTQYNQQCTLYQDITNFELFVCICCIPYGIRLIAMYLKLNQQLQILKNWKTWKKIQQADNQSLEATHIKNIWPPQAPRYNFSTEVLKIKAEKKSPHFQAGCCKLGCCLSANKQWKRSGSCEV